MQQLLNYIRQYINITEHLKDHLLKNFKYESFAKGDYIIKEGQYNRKMYFINTGACRAWSLMDGKEVTSWIYPPNDMICCWASFIWETPSAEYLEALSDMEVLSISKSDLQGMYLEFPEMESFTRQLYEQLIAFMDEFYRGSSFSTAKEKYDVVVKYYPEILEIANLGHIASFLGISQETLSRIRRMK